jgi:hypothetical protein
MKLTEILESEYPFKLRKHSDGFSASFKNANEKIIVSFVAYHIPQTGWAYEISFGTKKLGTQLTAKGDEFKTFATINHIVDEFLEKQTFWSAKKSARLIFITSDSPDRESLYRKLMDRMLKKYTGFKRVKPEQLTQPVQEWWNDLNFQNETVLIATNLKHV